MCKKNETRYYFVFLKDGSVVYKEPLEEINEYLRTYKVLSKDIIKVVRGVGRGRRELNDGIAEIIE